MHTKRRQNNMGGGNGGQHRHHNNRPRRFNNNRPSNGEGGGNDPANVARTRRNAIQSREKYQMMARDAMSMGDRVLGESYLQHADHYHRVLLALPPEQIQPQYLPGHNPQRDPQQSGNEQQPNGDGAQPAQNGNGNNTEPMQPSQGLPSFITQPVGQGNPEEQ